MDNSSNIEIGLCWHQEGTNEKWIYDITNNLMIDLETITSITSLASYDILPPFQNKSYVLENPRA
jgi:hypothetical protein